MTFKRLVRTKFLIFLAARENHKVLHGSRIFRENILQPTERKEAHKQPSMTT